MIELSPELLTILMLGGVWVGILTGYPLALILGGVALVLGFAVWGPTVGEVLYPRMEKTLLNYILLAVPLFIFMGTMLERTGIAEKMYDALYLWFGGLRGGLAIITILIGTILAACVGIIAASITMLTFIALPSMLNKGYSKSLAAGSVVAGGCLGILIPPSVMLIVYGPMAGISVGQLFFAAFIPGFTLSGLYIAYIAIRSFLQPQIAPAVSVEERKVPFLKKTTSLVVSMVPVSLLILAVLGTIFFGIAPPTEAAAIGALAATLLAVAYRKFNWEALRAVMMHTTRLAAFIFLILTMAVAFVGVFMGGGGGKVIENILLSVPGGRWGAFAAVMLICLLLGMFIEWLAIVLIIVPIITPVIPILGFDPLWFAIMVCINLQTSFMSPPFATGIFILRGAAPPELGVSMADIIRGVIPFIIIVLIAITLFIVFPEIILWLPSKMIG